MSDWDFLRQVFRGSRVWTGSAYLLLALTWISGIALLALSGWFITASALAGAGFLLGLELFTPSAGIRAAAILRTLSRYGERVIGHEAVLRVLARLRARSFASISRLPVAAQRQLRSGDLQHRLTTDIDTLDAIPLRITGPIVAATLAALAATGLTLWLAPWPATALLLATAGLTLSASLLAARVGRARGRALVEQRSRQRVALLDFFGGLADLIAYRRVDAERSRLEALEYEQATAALFQERVSLVADQAVQGMVALTTLAMLWLALHWHAHGVIDAPVAVLLTLMTLGLNEALSTLPGAFWRTGESLQAATRLRALGVDPSTTPRPRTRVSHSKVAEPPAPVSGFRVSNLAIGFAGNRPLLSGLNFLLEPGQPLVLHGGSGLGKSTLLETLAGERVPLSGSIHLTGRSITELPEPLLYRTVGYLPQETRLLDDSVARNLRLGQPELSEVMLWNALEKVDLAHALRSEGSGLDYPVGETGRRLSGGQARRMALAWLLLRATPVVLLDEPFSGLDHNTEQRILARIRPWLEARCAAIVTHAPERLPREWPRLDLTGNAR